VPSVNFIHEVTVLNGTKGGPGAGVTVALDKGSEEFL